MPGPFFQIDNESSTVNITVKNVRPAYLETTGKTNSAIWERSLTFSCGEGVIVHGPSGTGKSTFLSILFGLEKRWTGHLEIDGIDPTVHPIRHWPALRSNRITMVAQDFHLFERLSGRDNLRRIPRRAKDAEDSVMEDWASVLGIADILDRTPLEWSTGQRQRFAILRALAKPWRWLLLDEPYSHLDPFARKTAHELILSVCESRSGGWLLTSLIPDPPLPGITRSLAV